MNIKRYEIDIECRDWDSYRIEYVEDPSGDWVKFEDTEKLREELTSLKSTTDLLDRSLAKSEQKRKELEGKLEERGMTEIGADYSKAVEFNSYIGNILKQPEVEILSGYFAQHRISYSLVNTNRKG